MAQNDETFGAPLLRAIATGGMVTQPKPWLALFKQMPAADGSGGSEADYAEYCRIDATQLGIEGTKILSDPYSEAGKDEDAGKIISVVENQEIIHFPECEKAAMEGEIVGWGLYGSKDDGEPRLWGEFAEGKTVDKESIPIFRKEDFKLKVK